MEWVVAMAGSPEFWMGMSLLALAVPGPQTRFLPWLFKLIAEALSRKSESGKEGP